MKNPFGQVLFISFSLFLPLLSSPANAAEGSGTNLSEEQKLEKRLLFNQYVEDELARKEREKYQKKAAAQPEQKEKQMWISRITSAYGYDSNANLDSSRRGDFYLQETFEGDFKIDRPVFKPLIWPGKIGIGWNSELIHYNSYGSLTSHITTVSAYTEEKLNDKLTLKLNYDFSVVRYLTNDQLDYAGHKFKPTVTYLISQHFSHSVYASIGAKNFRDRKSSTPNNLLTDDNRRDWDAEAGYGLKWTPSQTTFIGVNTGVKMNRSNDAFNDYNDYAGYKLGGYIYRKLDDRFSLVAFTGYDHKDYDSRAFVKVPGELGIEKDDFYYVGGYFYYDINPHWQANLSYLYKENISSDASQDYTGWILSSGLALIF